MSKRRNKEQAKSPVSVDLVTGKRTQEQKFLVTSVGCWTYESETEKAIFEGLSTDTDRAAAIVASSLVDIRLEAAIRHRLRRETAVENGMFSPGKPVGSFSAKIDLAYLMNIVGAEARKDLHTIRDIRNDFAHELSIEGFSSQSIKDKVKNLQLIETHAVTFKNEPNSFVMNLSPNAIPRIGIADLQVRKQEPRSRFMITCSIAIVSLAMCESFVRDQLL